MPTLLPIAVGCTRPRTLMLSDERPARLAADAEVAVFVGSVETKRKKIAMIESDAFTYVDEDIKLRQIEQLQAQARRLGANAVEDVQILTKLVQGYTTDEAAPVPAWRQGEFELYFMRGRAVIVPDEEPGSLAAARPNAGWIVENLPTPRLFRGTDSGPLRAPDPYNIEGYESRLEYSPDSRVIED